jgi:hypothetical protein
LITSTNNLLFIYLMVMKKNILITLIKWGKEILSAIENKLSLDQTVRSIHINTLAPKILTEDADIQRIKPYLESLRRAIDTKGINNIALTGSYGSGKSTIIRTFQERNKDRKYLNISLASFNDSKKEVKPTIENEDENSELERKLEISILQQMFYHVKASQIPDSRFKRITSYSKLQLIFTTVALLLWIFSCIIVFRFNKILNLNPETWSLEREVDYIALFSLLILFTGIGLITEKIFRLLNNSKINKVSIKGELELGQSIDKSVFNQHLEEILYFFEKTEFNTVIIEDVDRFNSTDIFIKLREINILINNSQSIKREIKFIYAIKDEMFNDKNERVKFFEFIIPVIPFISPSNAADQLTKLIADADLQNTLSNNFTSDVVTFIDDIDMRLLINIFNEYNVYKSNLSETLNQDKLFSIIVYKNLYPDDFGLLGKRKGNLYDFFSNKTRYIQGLIDSLKTQRSVINSNISEIEKEVEKGLAVRELRIVYLATIISKLVNFGGFSVNSENLKLIEATEDTAFKEIKEAQDIKYYKFYSEYYNNNLSTTETDSGINFKSIENDISKELSYDKREQLIRANFENTINKLKAEKEDLLVRINEIESLNIQEIFDQVNIEKYLEKFGKSSLMRMLLLNGYIDENYSDYISIFHEVNLSKDDFQFIRNVKSKIETDFNLKLSKIDNIIKDLRDVYFDKSAILNYNLLDHLLINEKVYSIELDKYLSILKRDEERQFDFILGFLNTNSKNIVSFVKKIPLFKPTFWNYLNIKSGASDETKIQMLSLLFNYCDEKAITGLVSFETLIDYLTRLQNPLGFITSIKQNEVIKKLLSKYNVKFKNLTNPDEANNETFENIYDNNLYKLNANNLAVIISTLNSSISTEDLNTNCYTIISKSNCKSLIDYCSENLEEFVQDVLLKIPDNKNESEETILKILNSGTVSTKVKVEFLRTQNTAITLLSSIVDPNTKTEVLKTLKVNPTWQNIFDYYDTVSNDIDDELGEYLNHQASYLALSKFKLNHEADKDESYIKKFSKELMYNESLSLNCFKNLIKSLPYAYSKMDYDSVTTENLDLLLENGTLSLSSDNFNGLKSKGNNLHIKLVEKFFTSFITDWATFSVDSSDWVLIINSQNISIVKKTELFGKIDDGLIINNPEIADALFNQLPINSFASFRYEVILAIFRANKSLQKRISTLTSQAQRFNEEQFKELTELLGEDYKKFFLGGEFTIPYSNDNVNLTKELKKRSLINNVEHLKKSSELKITPTKKE